jgi:hypothetical protein
VFIMKNLKKYLAVITAAGMIGTASIAFALSPVEIASELTGKTTADLTKERASGKTYGTIAKEAGRLEEFKSKMLEERKAILDQRVKEGRLTQAQADEAYNTIKNNQAGCDGTGSAKIGQKYNASFGQGKGQGLGQKQVKGLKDGSGQGKKMGQGRGQGQGQGQGKGQGINR